MGSVKMVLTGIFLIAWLAVPARPQEVKLDDAKKELKKLQGVWVWHATEVKGGQDSSAVFAKLTKASGNATFTVTSNKWTKELETLNGMRFSYPGTVTIDPTTTPKKIDFTYDKGNPICAGQKILGVYELKGDTLRLAWGCLARS